MPLQHLQPIPNLPSKAIELFAIWQQNSYTITYASGAHCTFTTQTTDNLHYGDKTPTAPTVTDEPSWTFNGWSPNPSTTVTGNANYIAQWTQTTTITPYPLHHHQPQHHQLHLNLPRLRHLYLQLHILPSAYRSNCNCICRTQRGTC